MSHVLHLREKVHALHERRARACKNAQRESSLMLWQGKLRIGLAEQTVLVALAHATLLERGSERERAQDGIAARLHAAEQAVKLAYSQCPSYELLVPALLAHPVMVRRPCP